MLQLTADDLSNESGRLGPAESVAVKLGTESAVIPNLDYLETKISSLLR